MAVRAGRRVSATGLAVGGGLLLMPLTGHGGTAAAGPPGSTGVAGASAGTGTGTGTATRSAATAPARKRGTTANVSIRQVGRPDVVPGRRGELRVALSAKEVVSTPADFRFTAPRGLRFVLGERIQWAYRDERNPGSSAVYEISADRRTLSFRHNPALWKTAPRRPPLAHAAPLTYVLPVQAVPDASPGPHGGGTAQVGRSAVARLRATITRARSGWVRFSRIRYDAAGPDTSANLNEEYVEVVNDGREPADLTGWTINDGVGSRYTFGARTILPGQRVRLRSGTGLATSTAGYLAARRHVWANGGDTARLRDSAGHTVDICRWRAGGTGAVDC